MNRSTGTKLHSVIDALRAMGASEPQDGSGGDGWDAAHAKLCGYARAALPAQTLAELTLLADDIECSGMGGPLETALAYAVNHDPSPERRMFAQRLLGNVKKWRQS